VRVPHLASTKQHDGPLAQLVEQLTLNQRVVGSIPTRPIIISTLGDLICISSRVLLYLGLFIRERAELDFFTGPVAADPARPVLEAVPKRSPGIAV
jgi:hypothetical protein